MNELSTDVKKLNLWQKMRLRFFKRSFDVSSDMLQKYMNAPEYIKRSTEIIKYIVQGIKDGK